ncbi:MAG: alpha/beta hydrolase [Pseudomonadota bacterium]
MRQIAGILLVVLIAACSRAPDAVGVETVVPAQTVQGVKKHDVFIATTREPSPEAAEFFSAERDLGLSFASVEVTVPPTHEPGQIERTKAEKPDPRRHFTIQEPRTFETRGGFQRQLEQALLARPPEGRNVLVFIHGFNTTMTDAILQVAQFVEDTDYNGIPVLFSWASGGAVTKYVYDLNSALVARDGLTGMVEVMEGASIEHYDVLAHSMGNFLAMEVIRQASITGRFNSVGKARNIILASPDVDIDLFVTQLRRIPMKDRSFVVMVSQDDKALAASRLIDGGVAHVGSAPADELAKLGVIAIDLSEIDDQSSLSHSKFRQSPEIVQIIGEGLATKSTFGEGNQGRGGIVRQGVDGLFTVVSSGT